MPPGALAAASLVGKSCSASFRLGRGSGWGTDSWLVLEGGGSRRIRPTSVFPCQGVGGMHQCGRGSLCRPAEGVTLAGHPLLPWLDSVWPTLLAGMNRGPGSRSWWQAGEGSEGWPSRWQSLGRAGPGALPHHTDSLKAQPPSLPVCSLPRIPCGLDINWQGINFKMVLLFLSSKKFFFSFPLWFKNDSWDFPGGPVVKTLSFHCRGFQSLVGELRFFMLAWCGQIHK